MLVTNAITCLYIHVHVGYHMHIPFLCTGASEVVVCSISAPRSTKSDVDSVEVPVFVAQGCVMEEWTRCICRHTCPLL